MLDLVLLAGSDDRPEATRVGGAGVVDADELGGGSAAGDGETATGACRFMNLSPSVPLLSPIVAHAAFTPLQGLEGRWTGLVRSRDNRTVNFSLRLTRLRHDRASAAASSWAVPIISTRLSRLPGRASAALRARHRTRFGSSEANVRTFARSSRSLGLQRTQCMGPMC